MQRGNDPVNALLQLSQFSDPDKKPTDDNITE